MTSWKGSTMRKSSYDAHTPYDSNHALAGVLNGTQTYWSRGAATLRYFHEPVPAWSWQTPDGDCGWTHDPQEACLVAMTSLWAVVVAEVSSAERRVGKECLSTCSSRWPTNN